MSDWHILIVSPHIRADGSDHPNAFDAFFDGELICTLETPFFEAARNLLAIGRAKPDDMFVMRHARTGVDALRAKAWSAAKLTIRETGSGPKLRRYMPYPRVSLAASIEQNEGAATTLAGSR